MTASNGPEDKKPVPEGKEQRPYATLDLTAKEVSSSDKSDQKPNAEAEPSQTSKPASQTKENPQIENGGNQAPPPASNVGISDFASYMAAGALGGIIALIFGYFIYGGEQTPVLSPEEAQTLRTEISDADKRIASLEQALNQAVAKTSQLESSAAETQGLASETKGLAAKTQGLTAETQGLKETMATLTDRIAAIESRPGIATVTEQTVQQSLDPLTTRLAEIEKNLDGLSKAQSELSKAQSEIKASNRGSALALALYNLRRAANEGKPFAKELQTIAEMSPVPLDLAVLEEHRDTGVPSLEQLIAGFDKAANTALDAENKPSDDSLTSELWSKAKSFVRVRRKGDVPGDTTGAILARIEHRLQTGDLRAALSQAEQLKGPAAEAMTAWRAKLQAKLAAEEALSGIETKLLSALGSEDPAKRGG